ncbi:MAG: molecular chaperone TorD family protein [Nitrospirota bacterium]
MNNAEITITAGERAETYRFFAGLCLKPPSENLISMIRDRSIITELKIEKDCRGYDEMLSFVNEAAEMHDLQNELEAEHAALFTLPSGVIPHEGVFLDKEMRLGGKVTVSVRQYYEKAGAEILNECIEMPDHLGIELEFMSFLCRMEAELRMKKDFSALQRCLELQAGFLEEHLLKWASQCCEKIMAKTSCGFYRAIAYLIMEYLKAEEEYITFMFSGAKH